VRGRAGGQGAQKRRLVHPATQQNWSFWVAFPKPANRLVDSNNRQGTESATLMSDWSSPSVAKVQVRWRWPEVGVMLWVAAVQVV
jgi:hypothetical protein